MIQKIDYLPYSPLSDIIDVYIVCYLMKNFLSSLAVPLSIGLCVILGLVWLYRFEFMQSMSHSFNDSLTHRLYYGSNLHDDRVVIIKIDDYTLDNLARSDIGVLALDKWVYAHVLDNLFTLYDVAAVWIDVVFANPSILGEQDEQRLAESLTRHWDRTVIATRAGGDPFPLCLYASTPHWAINMWSQDRIRTFQLTYNYDISEYCRDSEVHPSNIGTIDILAYTTLERAIPYVFPLHAEDRLRALEEYKHTQEPLYISYFSNARENLGTRGFESYSLLDILEANTRDREGNAIDLSWKIILIGEVGTLLHDSHFTPALRSLRMPWVEVQANIIETLLAQRILGDFPNSWYFTLILILTLWLSIAVLKLKLIYSLIITIVLSLWTLLWWMFLFQIIDILFDMMFILLCIWVLYISLYLYRYQVIDASRRKLKKQFSLYVSPDVVEDISRSSESVILEGEECEMSVFFSDIVSFTTLSENMNSQELVVLLNEYFKEMTAIIHKNKGTLDKYIGDAVMCFFNAPLRLENHSYYACKTALEQQVKLRDLRKKWKLEGKPELSIRIWIHLGLATHGNIGSTDTRVNYTVIGDSVNLASRLEAICKEYGVQICVSESVYTLQKESFHFRELDEIKLKGKTEAVKIYELFGVKHATLPQDIAERLSHYAEWLAHYRAGRYQEAYDIWIKNTRDKASLKMAERTSRLIVWEATLQDGIYTMTHK